ncbi:hypothetical protein MM239_14420 [Belliella sp. DSM 111904]|uniref:Uncharacterized protein n=1 Tax=Belliella filtrata TaxID=2923435 RepID=A0ABS9V2L0_9BACT|nr:hypothetical protein [Belliella filtrata]MCH7410599.1 hypothetical protein [Belliella filtrata]
MEQLFKSNPKYNKPITFSEIAEILNFGGMAIQAYFNYDTSYRLLKYGTDVFQKVLQSFNGYQKDCAMASPYLGVTTIHRNTQSHKSNLPSSFFLSSTWLQMVELKARNLGIYLHQLHNYKSCKIEELLNIPSDNALMMLFAVGRCSKVNYTEVAVENPSYPLSQKTIKNLIFMDMMQDFL